MDATKAALAVAGVAAAGVLLLGLFWPGSAPAQPAAMDAASIRSACASFSMAPCVESHLDDVLMARGDEAAFQVLGEIAASDPSVQADQHNIAHHLGRLSLSYYPNATEALRHCPTTMASGCFHGVLERHFNDVGPPHATADLTSLCLKSDGRFRQYQCLHGLGHGLDMVAMHQLPTAIGWCQFLTDSWEQDSCASGVFMENVMGDTTMEHQMPAGMAMNMTWERLRPSDPLYPCNQVSQRWWHACYWMQSSILRQEGLSVAAVFAACDKAPTPYDGVCYESMGRDLSGATLRDGPKVLEQCSLGNTTRLGRCIYGAVQEMVNNDGAPAAGFAFCHIAPEAAKNDCYRGVGGMILALTADKPTRASMCQQSETAFIETCDRAAQA